MSKETILKIKEAEEQADGIRNAASAEAKRRVSATEAKGKKLCEETELRVTDENKKKLELIRKKADDMILHTKETAEEEARESSNAAGLHLREAVRYIIGGIMEECQ
ncbi:MAG: hypothetical protein IJ038_01265 [Clostridia bacterium]|nr:hypothetical protein [Clostridia bacterium]